MTYPSLRMPACCSVCGETGHNRLACAKRDVLLRVHEAAPGEQMNVAHPIASAALDALEDDERGRLLALLCEEYGAGS